MFVDHLNTIFIHIPKTGGNFISKWLQPFSLDKIVTSGHQDGVDRFEIKGRYTTHKHMTLQEYREQIGEEDIEKMPVIACVRHPISRALSYYYSPHRWFKIKRLSQFRKKTSKWVGRDAHLTHSDFYEITPTFDIENFEHLVASMKSMSAFLNNTENSDIRKDVIIRYEEFNNDLEAAANYFGIAPPRTFKPINKGHDWQNSKENQRNKNTLKNIVKKYHRIDFENFYPDELDELAHR